MYSPAVIEHFTNPHNIGYIEDATVAVQYGEPSCGDFLLVFLKIDNDIISEMKYKVLGCAAAIATASMTSVMATGRSVREALPALSILAPNTALTVSMFATVGLDKTGGVFGALDACFGNNIDQNNRTIKAR